MFKIAILFFAALIRCAEVEVKGKFVITAGGEVPNGYVACAGKDWTDAAITPEEEEPGEGTHATPYYATLAGGVGTAGEHPTRCQEMLALFATEDEDLADPFYIVVAASVNDDSEDLEIGAQACGDISECTGTFGVAYKLPKLQVLDTSIFKTDVMCQNFIPGDSGNGSTEDSPIYVYVDAKAVLEDHVDCGRVYKFGIYFVAVAGTTDASEGLDGATLGIKESEFDDLPCTDLEDCGMDGYAVWTGKMASATTTTTTSEATTTTSDDGSTTTSDDGSTTTSDDGSTTTSDDGSTTESTTSTSPPLDTTTEEDSTFFAAVGFSLFALLA